MTDNRAVLRRAAVVAFLLAVLGADRTGGQSPTPSLPRAAALTSLPIEAVHEYQVNGRVRLLFFWVGRDNVGRGRIVWRRGAAARGFELLLGTDPARAPRRLNRWGYLVELVHEAEAAIVGLMTDSPERSLEEAERRVATEAERRTTNVKAIRTRIERGAVASAVVDLSLARPLTLADVAHALAALDAQGDPPRVQHLTVSPETRPGFLSAMAELLHDSVARVDTAGRLSGLPLTVPFVYHTAVYDLTLRSADYLPRLSLGDEVYERVIRGQFALRSRATRRTTTFSLTYGTEGVLREVPIQAVYQPRWWLQIELVLIPSSRRASAPAR